jgi:hypothetical protein
MLDALQMIEHYAFSRLLWVFMSLRRRMDPKHITISGHPAIAVIVVSLHVNYKTM